MKKNNIIILFTIFMLSLISFFAASKNEIDKVNYIEKKEQQRLIERYYNYGSAALIYTNNLNENRYVVYGINLEFDNLKLKNIVAEIYIFTNIINHDEPIYSFNEDINMDQYEIYINGINDISMLIYPYQYQQTNYYSLNLELILTGFTNENDNLLFEQTIISSLVELPNSIDGTKAPKLFESISLLDFDFYYLENLLNAEYELGYENGFNDGTRNCSSGEFSLEWLIEVFRVVERFLDVELLPGFTIKLVILIPLVLSLLYALLKMLR